MAVGIRVTLHVWVDMVPHQAMRAHKRYSLHKAGRHLLRLEISEMTARDSGFCGLVFVSAMRGSLRHAELFEGSSQTVPSHPCHAREPLQRYVESEKIGLKLSCRLDPPCYIALAGC